ncbi:fibroblast growth factor 1-like [Sitophilus oryzae]|uniref:Fibroblast growth factor 1-like n=1 Tax=Sitophilus oryzae TaxID=7048 RepID=A0A6J2YHC6_SITOR|nr:fibroblast growth factor 1-like [Sitophilus oryzae]
MNNYDKTVSGSDSSSDDDSVSGLEEGDGVANSSLNSSRPSRGKRDVWCGVGNTSRSPIFPLRRVVWPPTSNPQTSFRSGYVDPRNARWGNPKLGSKMQLFSQTGYYLAVYPDGKVRGTRDAADPHSFLEIVSAGLPEHVRIKGLLTNMYVAMNKKGRLYAESDPNSPATVFVESFQGSYNAYLSRAFAHLGWYLGIKKSGKFKKGPKTKYGQKAVKFLPNRSRFE